MFIEMNSTKKLVAVLALVALHTSLSAQSSGSISRSQLTGQMNVITTAVPFFNHHT